MIVKIEVDELYPFYDFVDPKSADIYGQQFEVPDDTASKWERVLKEFESVQNEMSELFK